MHGFDAFIVAAGKFIGSQNILGVIVPDIQKLVILSSFCLIGCDPLSNLHIDFFILPGGNEVNLAIAGFSDVHRVTPTAQLQINHILKTCGDGVRIVAKDTVAQRGISQIELLLGFQQFLALQIITGAAVQEVSFFSENTVSVHPTVRYFCTISTSLLS